MIRARFIGDDCSMGFRRGEKYDLVTSIEGPYITIRNKETGKWCPYSSLEAFLSNWDILYVNGRFYGR